MSSNDNLQLNSMTSHIYVSNTHIYVHQNEHIYECVKSNVYGADVYMWDLSTHNQINTYMWDAYDTYLYLISTY